ncbi:coiled-coil domain-containing protein 54 [Sorex araneus]|uniref:coiled-coil domain-containing protein 54 n=1 Tax=Sorex araneus TaxID=42254 RepID=UPI0024333931|nr:coiled-coil domain-containing protein 54 [Sorex araneus]
MYKFQSKRVKAAVGKMLTSKLSRFRQSLKNVYHKSMNWHPVSTRYPAMTSCDRTQGDISTNEEMTLTLVLQDIKTAQLELLSQMNGIISTVSKIQEKNDFYQKQKEELENSKHFHEHRQTKVTKDILSLKNDIEVLKKKVTELENQNSCSRIHCLEFLEGEKGKQVIDYIYRLIQPETLKKPAPSVDSEISSTDTEKTSGYPKLSDHVEEKSVSPQVKTLKKSNHQNLLRIFQRANSSLFIYLDFYTWIKLTFVHGEKWRFLLPATKLEYCFKWLLSKPARPSEEPQLPSQSQFTGPLASLATICLSIFNYVYYLFGSSKEEVTRL